MPTQGASGTATTRRSPGEKAQAVRLVLELPAVDGSTAQRVADRLGCGVESEWKRWVRQAGCNDGHRPRGTSNAVQIKC